MTSDEILIGLGVDAAQKELERQSREHHRFPGFHVDWTYGPEDVILHGQFDIAALVEAIIKATQP
jgi:hypothetical protein